MDGRKERRDFLYVDSTLWSSKGTTEAEKKRKTPHVSPLPVSSVFPFFSVFPSVRACSHMRYGSLPRGDGFSFGTPCLFSLSLTLTLSVYTRECA